MAFKILIQFNFIYLWVSIFKAIYSMLAFSVLVFFPMYYSLQAYLELVADMELIVVFPTC